MIVDQIAQIHVPERIKPFLALGWLHFPEREQGALLRIRLMERTDFREFGQQGPNSIAFAAPRWKTRAPDLARC